MVRTCVKIVGNPSTYVVVFRPAVALKLNKKILNKYSYGTVCYTPKSTQFLNLLLNKKLNLSSYLSSLEIELAKKTITVIFSDKALETSLTNTKSYLSSLEIELAKKNIRQSIRNQFYNYENFSVQKARLDNKGMK